MNNYRGMEEYAVDGLTWNFVNHLASQSLFLVWWWFEVFNQFFFLNFLISFAKFAIYRRLSKQTLAISFSLVNL